MASFTVKHNIDAMLRNIRNSAKRMTDEVPNAALDKLGMAISNRAKINIVRQSMVHNGDLLNAIGYRVISRAGDRVLQVGDMVGLSYAAIQEFGSDNITDRVRRAMFRRLREEGKIGAANKNVMTGRHFRKRPYLRPAFDASTRDILTVIRDLAREKF